MSYPVLARIRGGISFERFSLLAGDNLQEILMREHCQSRQVSTKEHDTK